MILHVHLSWERVRGLFTTGGETVLACSDEYTALVLSPSFRKWLVMAWVLTRHFEVVQGPLDMKSEILVLEEPHGDNTASDGRMQMIERVDDFGICFNGGKSVPSDLGPTILFLEKLYHVELVVINDFFACRVVKHDAKEFLFFLFIGRVMYAVEAVVVVFEKNRKVFEDPVRVRGHVLPLEFNMKAEVWQFCDTVLDNEGYFHALALTLPADVAQCDDLTTRLEADNSPWIIIPARWMRSCVGFGRHRKSFRRR